MAKRPDPSTTRQIRFYKDRTKEQEKKAHYIVVYQTIKPVVMCYVAVVERTIRGVKPVLGSLCWRRAGGLCLANSLSSGHPAADDEHRGALTCALGVFGAGMYAFVFFYLAVKAECGCNREQVLLRIRFLCYCPFVDHSR